MLAYLDAGSGAALATVIASGTVGLSAAWGTVRRRAKEKLGRAEASVDGPAVDGPSVDGVAEGDGRAEP